MNIKSRLIASVRPLFNGLCTEVRRPRGQWPIRFFALAIATVLAGLLVSCTSIYASRSPYVGVTHYPASDPAKVQILRANPTKAYDRLGEVLIDASINPAPPIADVESHLRHEAAQLGADAVIVVYDRVQPVGAYVVGGWGGQSVQPYNGHRLVGVAIRYKR